MKRIIVLILIATVALCLPASAQKQYKLTDTVKLGGDGGWDYLVFDKDGQRLFITRGTHVMVVDTKTLKQVGDITGLSGVHGVALAPELQRGFISNGRDNSVTIFDLKTLAVKDTVKIEAENPDAILYEPHSKHVFTFNGRSKNSTVLDAATGKVLATIPLDGKPEFAATDSAGLVYVNIEDKHEITAIDVNSNAVKSTWPITGCEEPSALAFDVEHKRLFSGCDNAVTTVMNAANGKVVATVPIGKGVDAGAFNSKTGQVFMSCGGDGTLVVMHQDTPDKYSVVQTVATARGARTMTLDPPTNTVYTVTADFKEEPAADGGRPRRTMVPGTFKLLVLKPE